MVNSCFLCKKISTPLFKAPYDAETVSVWEKQLNIKLQNCTFVCYKHFSSDDIITEDVFKIDGKIVKLNRKRPLLKKGALPKSVLTKSPNESTLKAEIVNKALAVPDTPSLEDGHELKVEIISGCDFNFDFLKTNMQDFLKGNWGKHVTSDCIIYTHLSEKKLLVGRLQIDKAIKIDKDLYATVYLNSTQYDRYSTKLLFLYELENLFNKLESINVCEGENNKNCSGNIDSLKGKCKSCKNLNRNVNKKIKRKQEKKLATSMKRRGMQVNSFL